MLLQMPACSTSQELLAFSELLCDNITALELQLSALSDGDNDSADAYQPLLAYLETSSTLTSVVLDGNYMEGKEAPQATVSLLLDAIANNKNITKLAIRLCKTSVHRFQNLMVHGNIQDLEIKWCFWGRDHESTRSDADVIALAVRHNTSLRRVKLDRVGHKFVTSIVAALAHHAHLEFLSVHAEGAISPTATSPLTIQQALQTLTSTSRTLRHLQLNAFRLQSDVFAPIAQGLKQSMSVTCLSFHSCSFFRKASSSLLRRTESHDSTSVGSLLADLLHTNDTLQTLDMTHNNHIFCPEEFELIVRAIANSTSLKCFQYGLVHDAALCEIVLRYIPQMKSLPQIQLELGSKLKDSSLTPCQVQHAFQQNHTLTNIQVKGDFQMDTTTLETYAQRNQQLPQLLCAHYTNDEAATRQSSCLPLVLANTLEYHNSSTTIFRGLLNLSGQEYLNHNNFCANDIVPTATTTMLPLSKMPSSTKTSTAIINHHPIQKAFASRGA